VGAGSLWLVHDDDDNHQSALPFAFALQQQLDLCNLLACFNGT
jgi:hypothetical protein